MAQPMEDNTHAKGMVIARITDALYAVGSRDNLVTPPFF
jgi:hypothetical protein